MTISISSRDQIIINAHASGALMKDIAPLVNMTTKGVISACRRLGLAKRPKSKYSDDYVDAVIKAYRETKSYQEVHKRFPELATNKIAGIVYRAGASDPRPGRKPKTAKPKTRNRIIGEPKFKKVPFGKRVSSAPFLGLDISQLNSQTCRNPDPTCDDPRAMTYCGQPTYGTLPYCLACAQINYMPAQERRREPRPR
jgi:hypothetical protein